MRYAGLAAILLSVIASTAAGQELAGTLLVANRSGGSVSMFDLATRIEIARLPIGPRIPHEIAVSPDGRLALTGAYGPNDNPGRELVVIDVAAATVVRRIDLGPNSRPHSVKFLPDGRRAVATMESSDRLALVDVEAGRVLRNFPTGGREGHMVRLSPDGRRAYVTSRGAEGTLSVIDLERDVPPVVIATGAGAEGLAVTPNGAEVWVINRNAGSISIVDTERLAVVASVSARPGAGRAEISASGRALVPNGSTAGTTAQYLTVYDVATRTVARELALHGGRPASGAFGIAIVGERAIVADRAARSLLVYDLATLAEPLVIATGHDDPDGVAWSPVRVAVMGE